jgi:hypothetical protein
MRNERFVELLQAVECANSKARSVDVVKNLVNDEAAK